MNKVLLTWVSRQLQDQTDLELTPLRAEASFRSFYRVAGYRVAGAQGTCVVMVSPPDKEQNQQFEVLGSIFREAGIPVPDILAMDRDRGWYLLADLGKQDLEAAYAGDERDAALTAAIDALVALQSVRDPAIAPYTRERFHTELGIFVEWFVGGTLDRRVPGPVQTEFTALVDRTRTQPQCCVHRDYHCRNLLFNDGRLGIVDFQDALIGPASYDLASLLHDCYHEFTPAEVDRWIAYYLSLTPLDLQPEVYRTDVDYMAIQRQLKAVGIFARLRLRDEKFTHLGYIAPVLAHTRLLSARYPDLAALSAWLDELDERQALAKLGATE